MRDGKHGILAVDDDQDVVEAMRIVLEPKGYLMIEANTAEEGLKAYRQSSPDLLIVDLMMEEVDAGTSLVKELRALGNTAPVYLLSSVGDNLNAAADYSALGLSGVFQKPLNPDTLLAILRAKLKQ